MSFGRAAPTFRAVSAKSPPRPPKAKTERAPRAAKGAQDARRKRRSPEEARALLLRAAQRLLATHGPDAVGLKDVAREAGVSHALVTHYFGTIDALVDAALEAHAIDARTQLIARIAEHPEDGPREWMQHYFDWARRPLTAKLLGWALVTGRIHRDDFFSRRQRGGARVVDAILARLSASGRQVDRRDVTFAVLLLLAAPHGYALGRGAYWASLGVDAPGEDEDSLFFSRLADLVEGAIVPRRPPKKRAARARRNTSH